MRRIYEIVKVHLMITHAFVLSLHFCEIFNTKRYVQFRIDCFCIGQTYLLQVHSLGKHRSNMQRPMPPQALWLGHHSPGSPRQPLPFHQWFMSQAFFVFFFSIKKLLILPQSERICHRKLSYDKKYNYLYYCYIIIYYNI